MDKVKKVMETKFTGYIKIIYSNGNIRKIEKFEEILRNDEIVKK